MRTYAALDAGALSRFPKQQHPLWWGIVGLIMVEVTVVAGLIASYFYLKLRAPAWPPPGIEPPELLWPTINLVVLLCSCGTMYWAGWGINRGNRTILTLGTGISVLLAATVLVLRSLQISEFDFSWDSHAYGSIVWTITGFHYTHVASALVGTAVVTLLSWRGFFTQERQVAVVVDTLYWYFVCLAWIPFYLVLYWAPRIL